MINIDFKFILSITYLNKSFVELFAKLQKKLQFKNPHNDDKSIHNHIASSWNKLCMSFFACKYLLFFTDCPRRKELNCSHLYNDIMCDQQRADSPAAPS